MIYEIKIPSPGESITEVEIANWLVNSGDTVEKDQEIAEIESDKATLPLIAETSGKIEILTPAETTVKVGDVVCKIDSEKAGTKADTQTGEKSQTTDEAGNQGEEPASKEKEVESESTQEPEQSRGTESTTTDNASQDTSTGKYQNTKISPLAMQLMQEKGLTIEDVINGLARISKADVEAASSEESKKSESPEGQTSKGTESETTPDEKTGKNSRITKTTRMSSLRRKLSQRLVSVKNETAMLTTFNEADMSNVLAIRNKYKDLFQKTHGTKLGFMAFFTKAVTNALSQHPELGTIIDGENLITHQYSDIGIAVETPKGLMVPVIRNAESLTIPEIEQKVAELGKKAKNNKITIDEMKGGTFTITNGGVFGSLLSTPILNPPQSGILGMHTIQERPVAENGQVVIKPMMYLAVSYDHRVVDGATSVQFLVNIKEMIENPVKMLYSGKSPEEELLNL